MSQLVVIVAIEIAILVAVIVLREPKLLILAVVLGVSYGASRNEMDSRRIPE